MHQVTDSVKENNGCIKAGEWLRAGRESRGESLDDVARVTRISRGYLEAIEQGELHKLPSEAYFRGVVRLYAKHLCLSEDEALSILHVGVDSSASAQSPVAEYGKDGGSTPIPVAGRRRWFIPVVLLVFLVLFAVLSRMSTNGPVAIQPQAPYFPAPPTVAQPQPATPPLVERQEPAPAMPAEVTNQPAEGTLRDGIILRLKVVQAGRLHITIDGAVSQEYDLNEGDLVEWKAEKVFLLELDNAGSVEGDLNGTPLQHLGEPGRAAHLRVDSEGVRPQ